MRDPNCTISIAPTMEEERLGVPGPLVDDEPDDGGIARVHREIPDRSAKAEAIDELQGNRPSNGVDGNDLIVHLGVVDVPVREIDGSRRNVERDNRRVVDDPVDVHQRTVVLVADRSRRRLCRRIGIRRACGENSVRGEIDPSLIEIHHIARAEMAGPRRDSSEFELGRKV